MFSHIFYNAPLREFVFFFNSVCNLFVCKVQLLNKTTDALHLIRFLLSADQTCAAGLLVSCPKSTVVFFTYSKYVLSVLLQVKRKCGQVP